MAKEMRGTPFQEVGDKRQCSNRIRPQVAGEKKVQDALEWTAIPFGTTQSNQLKWSADDEQSIEGV